jgi:signal transduction histidine kinase/CheY-like chemotaxis protein
VRDPERDEQVVQAVVMDITDQREAELERQRIEKRMQHAQRLESLGLLAGGIAHDFNNLLVAVLGNADMALMEMAPESPARDAVESIRDAAIRAADLTNQLLAYSGKGRLAVQALDVNRLIEEMGHLFKVSLGSGAALQTDLAAGLPPVEADPAGLQQVLLNLVTNAVEAIGGAGGTVALRTRLIAAAAGELPGLELDEPLPAGRYVSLAVSDDGCGIAACDVERIFEPFYTTKFTGRGLGLAAVAGIVRSHGGGLRVDSRPGLGTTVEVLLPAGRAAAAQRSATAGCDFTGRGLVLVIDDEPAVHQVAEAMLRRFGFDVIHAHNGRSGWEQVAERGEELVLVLLDLTMPGTNGERTFGEIRRLQPGLPVVLCSGYGRAESVGRFGERAPDGFMQKPFDIDRLARVLQQVLGHSARPAGGQVRK